MQIKRTGRFFALFVLLLTLGCALTTPPTQTPPSTRVSTPADPTPTDVEPGTKVVSFRISEATTTRVRAEIEAGDLAQMRVVFEPVIYQVGPDYTSSRPWESHDVREMRICMSLGQPCQLGDEWMPFAPERVFEIPVDWLGPREFWVSVQFRDAHGDVVPSVGRSYQEPETVSQDSYTIVGVADETTPVEGLPSPVQTAIAATRTAFPVSGSVEIEGGGCCAGGTAGDTIQVEVTFEATSPFADVEGMRVRTGGRCFSELEMAEVAWEPYESRGEYPVLVALNWIGFYVSVQYRDAQGNLSPAYCDDISVEGHPPPP